MTLHLKAQTTTKKLPRPADRTMMGPQTKPSRLLAPQRRTNHALVRAVSPNQKTFRQNRYLKKRSRLPRQNLNQLSNPRKSRNRTSFTGSILGRRSISQLSSTTTEKRYPNVVSWKASPSLWRRNRKGVGWSDEIDHRGLCNRCSQAWA